MKDTKQQQTKPYKVVGKVFILTRVEDGYSRILGVYDTYESAKSRFDSSVKEDPRDGHFYGKGDIFDSYYEIKEKPVYGKHECLNTWSNLKPGDRFTILKNGVINDEDYRVVELRGSIMKCTYFDSETQKRETFKFNTRGKFFEKVD